MIIPLVGECGESNGQETAKWETRMNLGRHRFLLGMSRVRTGLYTVCMGLKGGIW